MKIVNIPSPHNEPVETEMGLAGKCLDVTPNQRHRVEGLFSIMLRVRLICLKQQVTVKNVRTES